MSSFIVSDKTINSIVTYIEEHRGKDVGVKDEDYILKKYNYGKDGKINYDQLSKILVEIRSENIAVDYFLKKYGYEKLNNDQLAQMLLEMNYQGSNAYYGKSETAPHIEYHPVHTSPEQALMSIECLLYQTTEEDAPEKSKTYKFLKALTNLLKENIAHNTPAYQKAEWGIIDNSKRKKMKA